MMGISNETRESIVRRLLVLLQKKYGNDLLFFGLKGSMARGDFDQRSDIDAFGVINGDKSNNVDMYYRDISINLSVLTFDEACRKVTSLSGGWWPFRAGALLEPRIIFDRDEIYARLHKAVNELREYPEKFYAVCQSGGYYEYYPKAIREYRSENFPMLRYAAWELFIMASLDLGLINQQYYTVHGPNVIRQYDRMTKFLPQGFSSHAALCFDNDPDKVMEGCTYLFNETKRWRLKFGIDELAGLKRVNAVKDLLL